MNAIRDLSWGACALGYGDFLGGITVVGPEVRTSWRAGGGAATQVAVDYRLIFCFFS